MCAQVAYGATFTVLATGWTLGYFAAPLIVGGLSEHLEYPVVFMVPSARCRASERMQSAELAVPRQIIGGASLLLSPVTLALQVWPRRRAHVRLADSPWAARHVSQDSMKAIGAVPTTST